MIGVAVYVTPICFLSALQASRIEDVSGREQEGRGLRLAAQGHHGGLGRRGKVGADAAVHVRRVRGGLRADQGGLVPQEGRAGRRGGADRHPGHGGAGGLRRHQGQLLQVGRGVPLRLQHHRG